MKIAGVIIAAGLGKRMNSPTPKVLHRLCGNTMIGHVLNCLFQLRPQKAVVVVGRHVEEIIVHRASGILFVEQKEAKGTADALLSAIPAIKKFKGTVIVLNGDTPLITSKTLKKFLTLHNKKKDVISILSFIAREPGSYGRVVRDGVGNITSIVEDIDATGKQKDIKEVNSGVYAISPDAMHLLKEIKLNELKGEYYLTDIISIAREKGIKVGAYCIGSEDEFMGVNTAKELERARQLMKGSITKRWMDRGVSFIDSGSVFISSDVEIGKGTIIYPNVHLEGGTKVGRGCTIYPNVRIVDSIIGDGAIIKDSTLIEGSVVKNRASVGPFAHMRPGSEIGTGAKIGNFVEVKKSIIGSGTKASHLTYLGDAKIGKNVNIGAGTITCNYDGYKKHITIVENDVFIGSDSQLIAPVKIGKGAYIGAGSTITKHVPSMTLALSRAEQRHIEGWAIKKLKVKSSKLKVKKKEKR
ncbi:MAG: bifunctional UDP-N-acetylglucosamine diphosphorylase/glucosamine-1-phosphate N-acetyltransferase GlmU [Nitrospirae bacterium]|nr:bifunctional UDP-N-acetylglucosamine diphosphorylase/glucosamine-1-phosphate N-acetyltransferase GlmU [Nitrospirota bacterium]